jgi:glycosyltransferase involved in cell wall biosynthesis
VVSTSVGAEGLPLEDGVHFLRADAPRAFADAVLALFEDPERRARLGAAGRRLVEERYSWTQVAAEFESLLKSCVNTGDHQVSSAGTPALLDTPLTQRRKGAESFTEG